MNGNSTILQHKLRYKQHSGIKRSLFPPKSILFAVAENPAFEFISGNVSVLPVVVS
jgi:hypothetical protein